MRQPVEDVLSEEEGDGRELRSQQEAGDVARKVGWDGCLRLEGRLPHLVGQALQGPADRLELLAPLAEQGKLTSVRTTL